MKFQSADDLRTGKRQRISVGRATTPVGAAPRLRTDHVRPDADQRGAVAGATATAHGSPRPS